MKIHCSVLAEDAIKAAIHDYEEKNGIAHDHDDHAHEDHGPDRTASTLAGQAALAQPK